MKNKINKFLAVWLCVVMVATGFFVVVNVAIENVSAENTDSGSWVTKAPMPTARSTFTIGVVNDKIYAIGGDNHVSGIALNKVEVYDSTTDTWTTKTDMTTSRYNPAAGVIGNKIYVIGGCTGTVNLKTVEVYDTTTDTWATKSNMPTKRQALRVAVINGFIYAIGGWTDYDTTTAVERYDPNTDTWSSKAPLPSKKQSPGVAVVDGYIYVIGGTSYGTNQYVNTVERYDPTTDTWISRSPMPTARYELATAVVNNKIYAIGGYAYQRYFNTVEVYDPATDSWISESSMPTNRGGLRAGAIGSKIYAIGGSNEAGFLGVNEELDTSPGPPHQPDLTLSPEDIMFSKKYPVVDETITIWAVIHNIGDVDVKNVEIVFSDGDPNIAGKHIATNVISVDANSNNLASTKWLVTKGTHKIYVEVDPNNKIAEGREDNNKYYNLVFANKNVYTWMWDKFDDRGKNSWNKYKQSISISSPFWYIVDNVSRDGEIIPVEFDSPQERISHVETVSNNNKLILPIVNTADQKLLGEILSDGSKRNHLVERIVKMVLDPNNDGNQDDSYDGVNIDFENILNENEEDFKAFLQSLEIRMHLNNKILTVDVHAKLSDKNSWLRAYDYSWILKHVDQMIIMAYDYYYTGEKDTPGPVAPDGWVEKVIQYAKEKQREAGVSLNKVILGIPFYGVEWKMFISGEGDKPSEFIEGYVFEDFRDKHDGSELEKRRSWYWFEEDVDGYKSHEPWHEWDKHHTVGGLEYYKKYCYQTQNSILQKLILVENYDLGGIAIWRIGGESEDYWKVIDSWLSDWTIAGAHCPVNLTLSDQFNRIIGYEDNVFINEIPGAYPASLSENETYCLPENLSYMIKVNGYNNGVYNFSISTAVTDSKRTFDILDVAVNPQTLDTINFPKDKSIITFSTNDFEKIYSLIVSRHNRTSSSTFALTNMTIKNGTTHSYTVLDWDNLETGNNAVVLNITETGPGAINSTIYLTNGMNGTMVGYNIKEFKIKYTMNETVELMQTLDGMDIDQEAKEDLNNTLTGVLLHLATALYYHTNPDLPDNVSVPQINDTCDRHLILARFMLCEFIKQVEGYRDQDRISSEDANILIRDADTTVDQITRILEDGGPGPKPVGDDSPPLTISLLNLNMFFVNNIFILLIIALIGILMTAYPHYREIKIDGDCEMYRKLGELSFKYGSNKTAIEHFKKAIWLNPNDAITWNDMGVVLKNKGKYRSALKCYDKAIETNPNYERAWYNKGCALSQSGDYYRAFDCFNKVVKLNAENLDAGNMRDEVLSRLLENN